MTEPQRERYRRQIMLPEIGEEGQEKIHEGKVLVIGTGGLGSPVLFYLAAAGIGTIGMVDCDTVDLSNLNRQILHSTPDTGKEKTQSAAEKLSALNPEVKLIAYPVLFTEKNGMDIIQDYDFIVDATDNLRTKYLINDLCIEAGKPFSHGAICGMKGHTFTYLPGSPCSRCLFDMNLDIDKISSSAPVGVLGTIAGIIGSIQATEAIKYITGTGDLLTGRLFRIDILSMKSETVNFPKRNSCRCNQ